MLAKTIKESGPQATFLKIPNSGMISIVGKSFAQRRHALDEDGKVTQLVERAG
jgi:hypothetical protein